MNGVSHEREQIEKLRRTNEKLSEFVEKYDDLRNSLNAFLLARLMTATYPEALEAAAFIVALDTARVDLAKWMRDIGYE